MFFGEKNIYGSKLANLGVFESVEFLFVRSRKFGLNFVAKTKFFFFGG